MNIPMFDTNSDNLPDNLPGNSQDTFYGLMTFRFLTPPMCIDVSEDSSADRKTKLTLMLTEPRNVPIVF